jgi:hypothetical protein
MAPAASACVVNWAYGVTPPVALGRVLVEDAARNRDTLWHRHHLVCAYISNRD